jgi:hypothetical protein
VAAQPPSDNRRNYGYLADKSGAMWHDSAQRWAPGAGRGDAADMHLSDHDLKQLGEDFLSGMPTDSLRSLSGKLLADLKEAHDRLNQNPSNSSRPPSTRAPWEKATAV